MKYELSAAQKIFTNNTLDAMWNHGVLAVFAEKYSYAQVNEALNQLVMNFETLRLYADGTQNICAGDFRSFDYPFFSFSDERELRLAAKQFISRPFEKGEQLNRFFVFECNGKTGVVMCAHHISTDGYSGTLAIEMVCSLLKNKQLDDVPRVSYQEYIANELAYKQTKRYERDKKFWKQQFSGNPVCSVFAEKSNSFDYTAGETTIHIPAHFYNKAEAFCRKNSITLQSFFNTVYAVCLYKTMHADSFAIGVPVLNRTTLAELNSDGIYMHIVPLFVHVTDGSFLQNALALEDSQINLFRHQKFTQYDIKEMLTEDGKPQSHLFDVAADFQVFEKKKDYEFEIVYSNAVSVPLEIHLQSYGEKKYDLKIRYRTALFCEREILAMLRSILVIAEDAIESPQKKVAELEMISSVEKQKILVDFNSTAVDYPRDKCICRLFEEQAAKMPEKTAVISAEETLTYEELNRRANRIAHVLIEKGVGKGDTVGVMLPRKTHLLSALFGILKTGAAYLPISLDDPQERIRHILTDSKAKMLVDEDSVRLLLTAENTENPHTDVCGQDTCYCIYTSGSTGEPKGACISHGSLLNRIMWMQEKYPLDANSVILQKTPYTFDVSVWELFWWSLFGGQLALSAPDEHFLPAKILEETEKNKVTHLHFVPSVFDLFLTYLEKNPSQCRQFASVKQVFLSGEALSAALVGRFYALFDYNKVKLANLYGPTECAIDVTFYDCTPQETDPIPIGKPISNTQIYAVDPLMNPMPVGVVGEICIAGDNVGQGYLNNTALTNEKFIPNPFGDGKLYKTGDLGYWREDGNIVFCGRKDNQIKLHGQRIEIGEIESVIAAVQTVQSVTVVLRTIAERQTLVAFYCSPADCEQQLRNHCELQLPHYMVPSVFVRLDSMPLNANGKTDRNALLQMPVQMADSPVNDREEVSDDERRICAFFADELGVEIGRNDDFFACGGTSLSMISLLSQDFFKQLSAADFIANPTPAKLALLMKNKQEPDFSVLQRLHTAENAEKALLLFPYAGGDAASFAALVQTFAKNTADYDLYFVPFLHRQEEFEAAAADILLLADKKQVCFYSHCAGSAVAARVLQILEKEDRQIVSHFVVGGSIPPAKPQKRNVWRTLPFFAWKTALKKAGAPFTSLEKEQTNAVYARFLEDTDLFFETFGIWQNKLCCPVSLLMSKKDPFTRDYKTAKQIWERYVASVCDVYYINTPSHYFQSHDSDETAAVLLSVFE